MKAFWSVMVWVDEEIAHRICDALDKVFDPKGDENYFYGDLFFRFCQWANNGWGRVFMADCYKVKK